MKLYDTPQNLAERSLACVSQGRKAAAESYSAAEMARDRKFHNFGSHTPVRGGFSMRPTSAKERERPSCITRCAVSSNELVSCTQHLGWDDGLCQVQDQAVNVKMVGLTWPDS